MNESDKIYLRLQYNKTWIYGKLEKYKLQFVETGNNRYLDMMNGLNETLECIKILEYNLTIKK